MDLIYEDDCRRVTLDGNEVVTEIKNIITGEIVDTTREKLAVFVLKYLIQQGYKHA